MALLWSVNVCNVYLSLLDLLWKVYFKYIYIFYFYFRWTTENYNVTGLHNKFNSLLRHQQWYKMYTFIYKIQSLSQACFGSMKKKFRMSAYIFYFVYFISLFVIKWGSLMWMNKMYGYVLRCASAWCYKYKQPITCTGICMIIMNRHLLNVVST